MIKSSAYAVTSCSNCPLAWSDEKESYYRSMCWHPMVKDQVKDIDDVSGAPPPDWCPLRHIGETVVYLSTQVKRIPA